MSDNLNIFGTTYSNVTGIKATDTNNVVQTFIKPSGTKSITANGTGIDVIEYASVDVSVPIPSPTLETKTKTYTPTESQQTETLTASTGYDAIEEVDITVGAIPSNYIGSGVAQRSSSDLTASTLTVTAPSGYYSANASKTLTDSNLTAGNIKSGTTIFGVTGSYSGTSKNVQVAQSTTRATSSSYTELVSLTCSVTGTYDVYWSTFRSSTSGTSGSQLYINDNAYGTAYTGSWSNHVQNIHLTNVSLTANDEVAVRARSRGSSYYAYVGTLTIVQK